MGDVNQNPVANPMISAPHRFQAKILQHRHVVGQIIICGACGRTAYECTARGAA